MAGDAGTTPFGRALAAIDRAKVAEDERRAVVLLREALAQAGRIREPYDRSWPVALAADTATRLVRTPRALEDLLRRAVALVKRQRAANEELALNDLPMIAGTLCAPQLPVARRRLLWDAAIDARPRGTADDAREAAGYWLESLAETLPEAELGETVTTELADRIAKLRARRRSDA